MSRTCGECRFYDENNCKGHPPTVTTVIEHGAERSHTQWPFVTEEEKACFKFIMDVPEDDRDDSEILYDYIKLGKRRTAKQIESHFDWPTDRLTEAVNILKRNKLVMGKQQGIAFYYVCTDDSKGYQNNDFDPQKWLLDALGTNMSVSAKSLVKKWKESVGGDLSVMTDTIQKLVSDKIVKSIDTNEGKFYLRPEDN